MKPIGFLFLILSVILILPNLALAQVTIRSMIDAAVNTTLYIASGVVVVLWIITGLLFLTAQGAPEKLKLAKTSLIASVAGTILVIIATSAIPLVKSMFNIT